MEEYTRCAECGMYVLGKEYHPYAACVLFRQTGSSDKVHDMLRDVLIYGYNSAKRGVNVDDAMRNIAASNKASTRLGEELASETESKPAPSG